LVGGVSGGAFSYRITSAKIFDDRIVWTALDSNDYPSINIYSLDEDGFIDTII